MTAEEPFPIGARVRTTFQYVAQQLNAETWEVIGYHENGFPRLRSLRDGTEWCTSPLILEHVPTRPQPTARELPGSGGDDAPGTGPGGG